MIQGNPTNLYLSCIIKQGLLKKTEKISFKNSRNDCLVWKVLRVGRHVERENFFKVKSKNRFKNFFCKKKLWVHKNSYRKNAKLTFIYVSSSKILITALCCQKKSSTFDSLINFTKILVCFCFFFNIN